MFIFISLLSNSTNKFIKESYGFMVFVGQTTLLVHWYKTSINSSTVLHLYQPPYQVWLPVPVNKSGAVLRPLKKRYDVSLPQY